MTTTLTSKGQVTIPKKVRDALQLAPGSRMEFSINADGQVVLSKAGSRRSGKPDRFERMRGRAPIKWRTDQLMALLRSD